MSTGGFMARPTGAGGRLVADVVSAGAWSSVEKVGARALGFVGFVVLARLLAPADFGLLSYSMAYLGALGLVGDLGMTSALVQRPRLDEDDVRTAFTAVTIVLGSLAVVVALASGTVADVTNQPRLRGVLVAAAPLIVSNAWLSLQNALLDRQFRFRAKAMASIVGGGSGIAAAIVAAAAGLGVYALVLQVAVSQIVALVINAGVLRWLPRAALDRDRLRTLFSFGRNVVVVNIVLFVGSNVDVVVVGTAFGARSLGQYVVARRLVHVVLEMTTSVLGSVGLTTFSRCRDDTPLLQRVYGRLNRAGFAVTLPLLLLLGTTASASVPLVLGEQWAGSVLIAQALAVFGAASALLHLDQALLFAVGRTRLELAMTTLSLVLNIVLMLVAAQFSPLAVAGALVAKQAVMVPVRLAVLRQAIGLDVAAHLRSLVPTAVAGAALYVVASAVFNGPASGAGDVVRVVTTGAAATLVYLAVLRLAGGSVFAEIVGIVKSAVRAQDVP